MESYSNKLNLMSYNCRRYNESKRAYILHLLSVCNILFIQEHWLSDAQFSIFNSINSELQVAECVALALTTFLAVNHTAVALLCGVRILKQFFLF